VRRIKMLEYALRQERIKFHKLKFGTEPQPTNNSTSATSTTTTTTTTSTTPLGESGKQNSNKDTNGNRTLFINDLIEKYSFKKKKKPVQKKNETKIKLI
jgi:hypothetical protein